MARTSKKSLEGKHYFFIFLTYIHKYPVEDEMPEVLITAKIDFQDDGGVNSNLFYRHILPLGAQASITFTGKTD